MRAHYLWLGILALAWTVPACVGPGRNDEALPRIGAILPLSGPEAASGEEVLSGLRLRVQEDGGVELVHADGASEPVTSARRLAELSAQDRVVAVVGGWDAAVARPLASLARDRGMPFLALSSLASPGAGSGSVDALHHLEGLALAAAVWAGNEPGLTAAGVLRDDDSEASRRAADTFAAEFLRVGGRIAWTVGRDEDGRIERPEGPESTVDFVFVGGPVRLVRQFLGQGGPATAEASYVTLEGWDSPDDEDGDGVRYHVTNYYAAEERRAVELFRAACEAAELEPTQARALGWDAAGAVMRLGSRVSMTRAGIAQALRTGDSVPGATGRLAICGSVEAPAVLRIDLDGVEFLGRVEAVGAPTP